MIGMLATLLLLLQEAEGAIESPTPSLLQPNAGLVIFTALAFGIVLVLLWKYAWGPIVNAMEERETKIEASLSEAERAMAQAKAIQADNQKALREAEQQAQTVLREAREEAERLRSEEVEKTRAQIRQLQAQAQEEIEQEKQNALSELRAEVADLAIQAASKILHENLDAERQRRLVNTFIDELPKN